VFNFTPRRLYPWGNIPRYSLDRRLGLETVGRRKILAFTGNLTLAVQLSYPDLGYTLYFWSHVFAPLNIAVTRIYITHGSAFKSIALFPQYVFILRYVDPLLGNDCEIRNYTTAVAK
jgi:hypothetical protein